MEKPKTIKEVIDFIKQAGCTGGYDPRFNRHFLKDIPSWDTFLIIREWRSELCAISYTKHLFNSPKAIEFEENKDSKCAYCTKGGRSGCPYGRDMHSIPAGTLRKGCEHWQENKSVYF